MANLFLGEADQLEIDDPVFDGKNMTNRVLVQSQSTKRNVYFCPGYMRTKIKNFAEMSMEDLQACVNTTIILTVNFRGIPPFLNDEIRSRMVLRFNRNEALVLNEKNTQVSFKVVEEGVYTYVVRKLINTGLDPHIFLSPFEIINLIMSITVQSVEIPSDVLRKNIKKGQKKLNSFIEEKQINQKDLKKFYDQYDQLKVFTDRNDKNDKKNIQKKQKEIKEKEQKIKELEENIDYYKKGIESLSGKQSVVVRFNLMDFPLTKQKQEIGFEEEESMVRNLKISFTQEGTFGNYDLAEKLLKVEYNNQNVPQHMKARANKHSKVKTEDYAKLIEFQNAHFIIPLYKFPIVSIFTIFLPLWLLGIINLGIFFQETGLADRIGSLAGLMIAFVALIPVIREELPPSPSMTLVQILVYIQTSTTLFCFIKSIDVRNEEENNIVWYLDGLFMASLAIELMQMLIIVFLLLRYRCQSLSQYNEAASNVKQMKFDYKKWSNIKCDQHFQRKIDSREVKIAKVQKKTKSKKKD